MSDLATRAHPSHGLPASGGIPVGAFQVSGYDRDDGAVLVLAGELDIATLTALNQHLDQPGLRTRARLVAEVSGLEFCDCAGLGALLRIHRRAAGCGGWLRLAAPTGRLRTLLRIMALTQVLTCYPGIDAAFAEPSAAGRYAVGTPGVPSVGR